MKGGGMRRGGRGYDSSTEKTERQGSPVVRSGKGWQISYPLYHYMFDANELRDDIHGPFIDRERLGWTYHLGRTTEMKKWCSKIHDAEKLPVSHYKTEFQSLSARPLTLA